LGSTFVKPNFHIAIFKATEGTNTEDVDDLRNIFRSPYNGLVSFVESAKGELKTSDEKRDVQGNVVPKTFSLKCKECRKEEFKLSSYEGQAKAASGPSLRWNALFPIDAESAKKEPADLPDDVDKLYAKIRAHYESDHPGRARESFGPYG
jgi:hypothetical protein